MPTWSDVSDDDLSSGPVDNRYKDARKVLTYGKRATRVYVKPSVKVWDVSPVSSIGSVATPDSSRFLRNETVGTPNHHHHKDWFSATPERERRSSSENDRNSIGSILSLHSNSPERHRSPLSDGSQKENTPTPALSDIKQPVQRLSSLSVNVASEKSRQSTGSSKIPLPGNCPASPLANKSVISSTQSVRSVSPPQSPSKLPVRCRTSYGSVASASSVESIANDGGVEDDVSMARFSSGSPVAASPTAKLRRMIGRILLNTDQTPSPISRVSIGSVTSYRAPPLHVATPKSQVPPSSPLWHHRPHYPSQVSSSSLTPLEELLDMCNQSTPTTFEQILGNVALKSVRKLGEATFSEVYSIPHPQTPNELAAVKILPFDGDVPVNGCIQQSAHNVLQEFRITKIMGDLQKETKAAFIPVVRLGIVKDQYPQELLYEWDRWDQENESESDRPDYMPDHQMYAILILEHAGTDLEHSKLKTWKQAKSLLGQAVASFSIAEKEVEFEHRDLHWGNFMLKPTSTPKFTYQSESELITIKSTDLRATIIDYTLSRLYCRKRNVLCFLALDDEDYFNGEGDYQFDCYRIMREETGRDWEGYHPKTNVTWLHYLGLKLLTKLPKTKSAGRKEFTSFVDRILTYNTCGEMIKDIFFADTVTVVDVNNVDDLAEKVIQIIL
ncbi:hypothetical protein SmJEL517_g02506 [Synchytrium microbalum]|uniref:non-specific serine/threonine protein kinase n=1 Tax=Synchytrium microbalum TaxID=1806994 RepID=A0A507C615_9FUNG|nr:uncharacterized protein SmJEL517_g02506 [Synchytrium microbalum]TPX35082.1 hypothetical protein SmJEL517_g02506 [Synchytrium microbalum]